MRATPFQLTLEEQGILDSWVRNGRTEQRLALKGRIILAAAEGEKNLRIAQALALHPEIVSKWRLVLPKTA